MITASKTMTRLMILCALTAIPLCAQSPKSLKFTTSFPFYVDNQYMPAGSYTLIEPNTTYNLLRIEAADDSHSAFVEYNPTSTLEPARQGEVAFRQFGSRAFLDRITVSSHTTGMDVAKGKREKEAAGHQQASVNTVPLVTVSAGD